MKINLKPVGSKIKMAGLVIILLLNCGAAQAQPQQGLMSRLKSKMKPIKIKKIVHLQFTIPCVGRSMGLFIN
jgi:hypothetical protein